MTKVNLYTFKAKLSEYSRRVKDGESLIICDRNKPFAEFRPIPAAPLKKRRPLGLLKGACRIPNDFNESNSIIENLFQGL